jgi:hypothetical protein
VPELFHPLYRSAEQWGMPRWAVAAALLVPVVGLGVLLVLRLTGSELIHVVADEDGLLEWAQFAFAVGIALLSFLIARLRRRSGHPWQAVLFIVIGLGFIFVAGEEISWGQRLLGFETPEDLRNVNVQGETTLHNIGDSLKLFNLALLAASLYAIVAGPIARRFGFANRRADAELLFLPPLVLMPEFAFMAIFRIWRFGATSSSSYFITRISELAEFLFYGAVFLFLLLAFRRLRSRPEASASREPSVTADG